MYKDPEKQKAFQRQWQRQQKLKKRTKVLEMLGGKCKRCGYNENVSALQIDHIKPVLRNWQDKRDNGCNQPLIAKIYKGEATTENLQILCANCHAIKTREEDSLLFKQYNPEVFVPSRKRGAKKNI